MYHEKETLHHTEYCIETVTMPDNSTTVSAFANHNMLIIQIILINLLTNLFIIGHTIFMHATY